MKRTYSTRMSGKRDDILLGKMTQYSYPEVNETAELLRRELEELDEPSSVLKSNALKELFMHIKDVPQDEKAAFGAEVNSLKQELDMLVAQKRSSNEQAEKTAIDITAPFDINTDISSAPTLLPTQNGSIHPLMGELASVLSIFTHMGFTAEESRQIDDDYHMFGSLNFPEDHPARDDFDTFNTEEGLVIPAHTSTMQHRMLQKYKSNLEADIPIQVVIPGQVSRNEDVDARHDHTFYQVEGVYVGKNISVGNLIATLQTFLESYYEQKLEVKTQPFYFPFTEPSFEFALSCPFCQKKGCSVCSYDGWIELLGCGMIHPNVLREAEIDPEIYTGFAWGFGLDRLVMMKYGIEDIRYFHSGKLDFLTQFRGVL